jgi:hypothetical protein
MTPSARRLALGLIALIMFAVGCLLYLVGGGNVLEMWRGICIRVGMTLGAAWLAFPQLMQLSAACPPRLLLALAFGGVVVVARPQAFRIVAPLIGVVAVLEFVGWLMKPIRPRGRPPRR